MRGAVEAAEPADRLRTQFGPFAVAQLRLIAELQALMSRRFGRAAKLPDLNSSSPTRSAIPLSRKNRWCRAARSPIAAGRQQDQAAEPITVVIGNPPYKEKAEGHGGWIEQGSGREMARRSTVEPPREWQAGAHAKHLKNLYIYFWRWATWKVFGTGHYAATGLPTRTRKASSASSLLPDSSTAPASRRCATTCAAPAPTSGSSTVRRRAISRMCRRASSKRAAAGLHRAAARKLGKDQEKPADGPLPLAAEGTARGEVRRARDALARRLGTGSNARRTGVRRSCRGLAGDGRPFPPLKDFFDYDGSGVMPGRTWMIAPDRASLEARWGRLIDEKDPSKKEELFHPHLRQGQPGDKHVRKTVLPGSLGTRNGLPRCLTIREPAIEPIRYGFRSFDRQWIIPDARLINQPNPTLWNGYSQRQIYLTAP